MDTPIETNGVPAINCIYHLVGLGFCFSTVLGTSQSDVHVFSFSFFFVVGFCYCIMKGFYGLGGIGF